MTDYLSSEIVNMIIEYERTNKITDKVLVTMLYDIQIVKVPIVLQ